MQKPTLHCYIVRTAKAVDFIRKRVGGCISGISGYRRFLGMLDQLWICPTSIISISFPVEFRMSSSKLIWLSLAYVKIPSGKIIVELSIAPQLTDIYATVPYEVWEECNKSVALKSQIR